MIKSDFILTSKQLLFLLIGSQIATGIYSLPRITSSEAGQDAWIAVIIGGIVPLLSLFMIERLHRNFPNQSFVQMTHLIFGKWVGTLLIIFFVLYIIYFQAIVLRLFSDITSVYLLPQTPIWAISLLAVTGAIYVAIKGAKVVGRMNELLFYLSLFAFFFILIPGITEQYTTNMLPIAETDINTLIMAAIITSYSFAGIEVLFVVYSMVTNKKEILKAGFTALIITIFLYAYVVIICLLVFGAEVLQEIMWPVLVLLKVIELPVFQRIELFFLAIWIGLGIRPIINLGFAACYSIADLFNKINLFHYITLIVYFLIFIIAQIPKNILETLTWSDYGGYLFLFFGIGYPILFHIVFGLRKEQVMKNVQ